MSINVVSISGNLTKDAECRATQSGTSVVQLSVAVNERRRDQQTGEWAEYANFIDCVQFCRSERQANFFGHLAKGTKVAVQGKLHWSSWERDGQRRSKVEVYVDQLEVLSRNGQQDGYQPQQQAAPRQQDEFYASDLPF